MSDEIQGPVAVIPLTQVVRIVKTATGTSTIFTTPLDKDFYLTNLWLTYTKTAADAGTAANLTATIEGVATIIASLTSPTLTADSQTMALAFPHPIKIDRGTNFSQSATSLTQARSIIYGFAEEVTK